MWTLLCKYRVCVECGLVLRGHVNRTHPLPAERGLGARLVHRRFQKQGMMSLQQPFYFILFYFYKPLLNSVYSPLRTPTSSSSLSPSPPPTPDSRHHQLPFLLPSQQLNSLASRFQNIGIEGTRHAFSRHQDDTYAHLHQEVPSCCHSRIFPPG